MDQPKLATDQKKILIDFEAVKKRLLELPNVVAVGCGIKETGGEFTDKMSYRVYVSEKKDVSTLGEDEVIPDTIGEFDTDVLKPLITADEVDLDPCGDERRTLKKHRPLQAGIAVSRDSLHYGTLGWFATLDIDDSKLVLSNKHVLYNDTNEVITDSNPTAQPQVGEPSQCCCCECGSDNVIGSTVLGVRDVGTLTATSVDAAIARIDPEFASDIVLSITNESTEEVLTVSGTASAVVGEEVRKIGARSGFTRGTVVHVGDLAVAPTDPVTSASFEVFTGQILISPVDAETYEVEVSGTCVRAFSNKGDSGAVVLNSDDEVIGINWRGSRDPAYSVKQSVACSIDNVLTAFADNGFPITIMESPGGGEAAAFRSAGVRAVRAAQQPQPDQNVFERLRDANRESLLHWIFERHHREVLELINHKRPVTVAWRRNQGPAFVAALARAARVEHYRVPFAIDGISREALLQALEVVLLKHGSPRLQTDIARYRDDIFELWSHGGSVEEMAELLKERGFLDAIPRVLARSA